MPISQNILEELILKAFPDAEIEINDLIGDQNHYELKLKSAQFSGINKMAQHKLVHQALKDYVGTQLHALTIKTSAK